MNIKKLKDGILISKFLRYSIAGWIGAGINVFFLRFFTDVVGIFYILSAIFAFIMSLVIWFFLQKYFTFRNKKKKYIRQLSLFVLFQWIWLIIDVALLRLLVDTFWFYYLYVSIFNKAVIFIRNFVMNHFFTFYKNE